MKKKTKQNIFYFEGKYNNKLTKFYKDFAVATPLKWWESENAGNIIILTGLLLFGEVTNHVVTAVVDFAKHVEQERVGVVVKCLVVEEEFGKEAEILGVHLFKKRLRCDTC